MSVALSDVSTIESSVVDAAYSEPLETFNPAQPELFESNTMWPYFERLRKEAPVHYTPDSRFGPFWSVTKFHDIVAIDTNHKDFSSEPAIALQLKDAPSFNVEGESSGPPPMFIAMDPPKHDVQRKTVSPVVAPANLAELSPLIRERAGEILDNLPIGEEFDWVDLVSKELTGMTLATLFGIPMEDHRQLLYWSDVVTAVPGHGLIDSFEEKFNVFQQYRAYFVDQWNKRKAEEPSGNLVSMLAHGEHTKGMTEREYFGNVILLTVGGNDTTRNSISGSILALNQNPDEYNKLRANPDLIPSMVSETIRWQTPLAHMTRRAVRDVEFKGQKIKKGDQVVMWYVSGNRDEEVIDRPDEYIIDRERPRHHISFGFGIHRCVGNRLAELQLTIIWEEIMKRFPEVIVASEPKRTYSTFVKGYESMKVVIPKRN